MSCPCEGLGTRLRQIEDSSSGSDCISTTISTNSFEIVRTISVSPSSTNRITIKVLARESTGDEHATFQRVMLVSRSNNDAVILHGKYWHTSDTIKSNITFDLSYELGVDSIVVKAKNAHAVSTVWRVCIDTMTLT